MLATLGPLPHGPDWAFEFKWDGARAVVAAAGRAVRAVSRNDREITASYPELSGLPKQLGGRAVVLDGELVTLDARGATSFGLLQERMHVQAPNAALVARIPVWYYAFDLLWIDGEATLRWPYRKRRQALTGLRLLTEGPMSIPPSHQGPGEAVLEEASRRGFEGVVAKRVESAYEPGRRSTNWIKVPLNQTQEVIVIGWRAGKGRRADTIGSLLLAAYNRQGALDFIGQVGTGFTGNMLKELQRLLEPLRRSTPPVTGRPVPRELVRDARWTEPELVGEVEFRSWTPDGRLRHPSWRGLRPDKRPAEVQRPDRS